MKEQRTVETYFNPPVQKQDDGNECTAKRRNDIGILATSKPRKCTATTPVDLPSVLSSSSSSQFLLLQTAATKTPTRRKNSTASAAWIRNPSSFSSTMFVVARSAFIFSLLLVAVVNGFSCSIPSSLSRPPPPKTTPAAAADIVLPYRETGITSLTRRRQRRHVQHMPLFCSAIQDDGERNNSKQAEKEEREFKSSSSSNWPWSDSQSWVLRDQLPKYTIQIPHPSGNGMSVYVLWRTLSEEVTELSGYPVEVLLERAMALRNQQQSSSPSSQQSSSFLFSSFSPTTLPYLDDFEFSSAGGLLGRAYGIPGLAEGSRIETAPVSNLAVTVPKGFVQVITENKEMLVYELGRPKGFSILSSSSSQQNEFYSLDYGRNQLLLQAASQYASNLSRQASDALSSNPQTSGPLDPDLLNLGALTALVIGGALAVDSLSHHLTINMFWV